MPKTAPLSGPRLDADNYDEFFALLEQLGVESPAAFFRKCAVSALREARKGRKIKWPPEFAISADPLPQKKTTGSTRFRINDLK